MAYVKQGRNAIVLRTFSKIYGFAGLRIGYGVTTAEIANMLEPRPAALQRQQPGAACRARRTGRRRTCGAESSGESELGWSRW